MIEEREELLHAESGRRVAPLLLKPEEAAEALGIARTRVYQLMRAQEIRSVKIGKVRRIPVAALQAYVERLQGE
jgi:excisionase family DNA binding protein